MYKHAYCCSLVAMSWSCRASSSAGMMPLRDRDRPAAAAAAAAGGRLENGEDGESPAVAFASPRELELELEFDAETPRPLLFAQLHIHRGRKANQTGMTWLEDKGGMIVWSDSVE